MAEVLGVRGDCIRFVPIPDEYPGYDACLIVTEYPYLDMSHSNIGKGVCTSGKGVCGASGGATYDNVDSPDEANVNRILSDVHQFAYLPGFCKNPHDRIVDWLLANREHISYPCFLGNSNDRAVEINIAWLDEHYTELMERFDENPELTEIYGKYLTTNTNPRMFWYVMEKCDYHKPINYEELMERVDRMPFPVDIVWEWNRATGWV